jgi:hypothetical protein
MSMKECSLPQGDTIQAAEGQDTNKLFGTYTITDRASTCRTLRQMERNKAPCSHHRSDL